MQTFNHGIPKHSYFAIVVPPSKFHPTLDAVDPGYKKPVILLHDPKTKERTTAEVQDTWTIPLDEFKAAKGFVLLIYGVDAEKLAAVLCRRYPEIEKKKTVRILLLKAL